MEEMFFATRTVFYVFLLELLISSKQKGKLKPVQVTYFKDKLDLLYFNNNFISLFSV